MVKLALVCFTALMGVVIGNMELKLWTAAQEGDMTHVDKYIAQGTSPLWQNPDSYWPDESALHIASRNNHSEVVKRLLDVGVDVNLNNERNQTALIIASEEGYTDLAKLLIDNGAEVNLADEDGRTPLHKASFFGHTDIATLLITNGAEVNLADKDGETPLHMATFMWHTDLINLLISNGAEVNHVDELGQTPLHTASIWGYTDIATLLLANGADTGITDKYDKTAGDIARSRGDIQLGNIIDSYTSTTVRATSPTPALNAKHAPRPIRLLRLMQLLHPTG